MTHTEILNRIYGKAEKQLIKNKRKPITKKLSKSEIQLLTTVDHCCEKSKGASAVLITSLVQKIFNPKQDVRYHQENMKGGYSGRGIDKKYITPFLREKSFPFMASGSGWLTRSLEQNYPYTLDYRGKMTPLQMRDAFLHILNNIEIKKKDPEEYLIYLFQLLIVSRDEKRIDLAKPSAIPISTILHFLHLHFYYKYSTHGGARLPVLAIFSTYQTMMSEVSRFSDKTLLPLKEHTSADIRSGYVADIDIKDTDGKLFEAVEIKHGIKITKRIVKECFEKFKSYSVKRYYVLSTAGVQQSEEESIDEQISEIAKLHGCEVIVNGIMPSLKYYLRLLKDPSKVIEDYVDNLKRDKTIKFEHKDVWNKIVAGVIRK